MNAFRRLSMVLGGAAVSTFVLAGVAMASAPASASDVVGPAASDLKTQLLLVAAAGATAGIVIVAVRRGWRLVQKFF